MAYAIGIDTGGTYTDAVVYDPEQRSIIVCAKALTTRGDLSVGILNALDGLDRELSRQAGVICWGISKRISAPYAPATAANCSWAQTSPPQP